MRKQEKQAVTHLIRPKLSEEEKIKKSENEAKIRKRRDEGINSILIADVSDYLEAYKGDKKIQAEIKRYKESSKAVETFKRLEKERVQRQQRYGLRDWGNPPTDDRETFQDDWWKTDALIKVANEGIAYEKKYRRKQKMKKIFHVVSGRRFLNTVKSKRKQKQELKSMTKDFMNYVPIQEHVRNDGEPLSANMYNFLYYIISYKRWDLLFTPSENYELLHKFKSQYKDKNAIMEHSPVTDNLLKDLYCFFKENH